MKKEFVLEFVKNAGLGNQMFEWAAGLAVSKRLGVPYRWKWLASSHRKYGLGAFGIAENPPPGKYDLVMQKVGQGSKRLLEMAVSRVKESRSGFPAVSCPFQDEECFAEVADEIRTSFRIEPLPIKVAEGVTPVAVQVRRGDYAQHPRLDVVTATYFAQAMEHMRRTVENPRFFFTSDDLPWCRKNFGARHDVKVMDPHSEMDGLRMMVACKAHIISNSTYGWWGAWLGEDGPVVAPDKWHMGPGTYGDWMPVPERWHRVGGTKVDTTPPLVDVMLFKEMESLPSLDRAIIYPWKAESAKWQELRYSLRSIDKFFEDKECPIYILGTQRPGFLLYDDPRVSYISTWSYWEALNNGIQMAKKVLWMNDDLALLKPTTWEDCEVPYYLAPIQKDFLDKVPAQPNAWRAGAVKALKMLRERGYTEQKVYSTHLPYVYERYKAMEVMKAFGIWNKIPYELIYFHLHPVGSKRLTTEKTTSVPFGDAQFLNYVDELLTPEMKGAIMELLPDFAPWELKRKFSC